MGTRTILGVAAAVLLLAVGSSGCRRRSAQPTQHRPVAIACAKERAAGQPEHGAGSTCKADAECTAGKNGRCVPNNHGDPRRLSVDECTYDRCFADADCGGLGVCQCGHSATTAPVDHVCLPAACRIDADCGAAGFCSPSYQLCAHDTRPSGYFCHGERDECFTDGDCPKPSRDKPGPIHVQCGYSKAAQRWLCMSEQCPVG